MPDARRSGEPLPRIFARAVRQLCANADAVGVMLSGGMDSLAVLTHVSALRPARRVAAFTVDLVDDEGVRSADVVRRLLRDLPPGVELTVIDPASCTHAPTWSAHGPRFDALPTVNAAIAHRAAESGMDVLLTGAGADELMGVPRFATMQLARSCGTHAAIRYLRDSRRAGPGILGELAAMAAQRLPASARARAYWAANWPDMCDPAVAAVVPDPLRSAAREWAHDWITATIRTHAEKGRSWMESDAADAFWPRPHIPPAGAIPEGSPYLDEDFVAEALALPPHSRYDATATTPYWRCKSRVIQLLPEHVRAVAPRRKQYFTAALAASVADPINAPHAVAAGLINPDRLARESSTPVRMMVAAVERWLAGAVAAGVSVPAAGA